VRLFLTLLIFFGILAAQKPKEKSVSPCEDPLIELAQTKGIKAVPLKDIRRFNKLLKACERQGGKEEIKQLYHKDWQRDYNSARRMASWTSTHAMCVFVSFGYYFAGRILATTPSS
jgi:hypothetical protein